MPFLSLSLNKYNLIRFHYHSKTIPNWRWKATENSLQQLEQAFLEQTYCKVVLGTKAYVCLSMIDNDANECLYSTRGGQLYEIQCKTSSRNVSFHPDFASDSQQPVIATQHSLPLLSGHYYRATMVWVESGGWRVVATELLWLSLMAIFGSQASSPLGLAWQGI